MYNCTCITSCNRNCDGARIKGIFQQVSTVDESRLFFAHSFFIMAWNIFWHNHIYHGILLNLSWTWCIRRMGLFCVQIQDQFGQSVIGKYYSDMICPTKPRQTWPFSWYSNAVLHSVTLDHIVPLWLTCHSFIQLSWWKKWRLNFRQRRVLSFLPLRYRFNFHDDGT